MDGIIVSVSILEAVFLFSPIAFSGETMGTSKKLPNDINKKYTYRVI